MALAVGRNQTALALRAMTVRAAKKIARPTHSQGGGTDSYSLLGSLLRPDTPNPLRSLCSVSRQLAYYSPRVSRVSQKLVGPAVLAEPPRRGVEVPRRWQRPGIGLWSRAKRVCTRKDTFNGCIFRQRD